MAAVVFRTSVFRDTDQTNRILSILNEQRATSRFCDVILKVREDHIFAHSNVLAAASPYFGSFLGLGSDQPRAFCEKTPQVIEIQIDGADAGSGYGDAVRHVVEYMYTCSLELNSVIISQIAEIARIMQIQRVLDYCDRFIKGENGAQPLDKKIFPATVVPDYGTSRRVKKTNASTETELMMFQKSSGLSIDKLQQELVLSSYVPCRQDVDKDTEKPNIAALDSAVESLLSANSALGAACSTDCQNSAEKGTQLDSDSLSDSQEKPVTMIKQEDAPTVSVQESQEKPNVMIKQEDTPIVVVQNEEGIITSRVAVPFITMPVADLSDNQHSAVVKQDHPFEQAEAAEPDVPVYFEMEEKVKVSAPRGRKRGRPSYRGRGRRRKMREVLSDSDPELIQEPDDTEASDVVPSAKPSETELDATSTNVQGKAEAEDAKDLNSEVSSSQETLTASASATDSTVSVASGESLVKEEALPETLTRTRGRKPITSVMVSWTSPRRRAGIPRSVFRSDYVMHSLIKRSRQSVPLQSPPVQAESKDFDEMEGEGMEVCDALSKTSGGASSGMESAIKFVCQTCDFTTVSFRLYRQHMKRHPETDTRSYTCTECNFHTTKARELLQHRKKHLHEDLICSYCESQFDTAENFELHLQRHSHSLPYFCHACDMRFKTRTQLTTHLPKHRTEKPFVCQICGNGFKWKHALKSHMVTHSATKDHLCDICGFATAHKSQLKAHRLIHTGDTFKCPEPGCQFEATKRQNLKYHMVTHTQEKAHQCEVCGQAFSLIKNMRRHKLLHNDTRPFHCSVCSYTTTRYDKLKEHKLKQHGIGQPPGKKRKYGDIRQMAPGAITIAEDGTMVKQSVEGLQMVNMIEPITIAQDGDNITIRSDVTLTDEALQTIAQIATSSSENVGEGDQPQEAQINIGTSEGIPIIARVQFTSAEPEIVSYVAQVQE